MKHNPPTWGVKQQKFGRSWLDGLEPYTLVAGYWDRGFTEHQQEWDQSLMMCPKKLAFHQQSMCIELI